MPQLSDYMGAIFEDMCKNFIIKQSADEKMAFFVLKTGKWWGTNPIKKREEEIDIVASNPQLKKMLLGECKYRKELVTIEILNTLLERGNLLPNHYEKYFCLFSISGFEKKVVDIAGERNTVLYTLDTLYEM